MSRQRGHDAGPADPFGLSWLAAISLRKPQLLTVGFPWISLDSLVRIETYQCVTRDFRWKFFLRPFSPAFTVLDTTTLLKGKGAGLFMGQA
jgi:hypothetical protein